jgi:regulation of enolase protein 1 (concanavalin A-like superfamily)
MALLVPHYETNARRSMMLYASPARWIRSSSRNAPTTKIQSIVLQETANSNGSVDTLRVNAPRVVSRFVQIQNTLYSQSALDSHTTQKQRMEARSWTPVIDVSTPLRCSSRRKNGVNLHTWIVSDYVLGKKVNSHSKRE